MGQNSKTQSTQPVYSSHRFGFNMFIKRGGTIVIGGYWRWAGTQCTLHALWLQMTSPDKMAALRGRVVLNIFALSLKIRFSFQFKIQPSLWRRRLRDLTVPAAKLEAESCFL